ncbi:MAG TPA: VLRF1 family aeRF1-type release factor [Solirubrobacterales bacterium]
MIPDPDLLNPPNQETPRQLLAWRPPNGVLSLYVSIEPGDRSNGWRTAVRNGLSKVTGDGGDGAADHEARLALRETVARLERALEEERKGEHRGLIGFVEVARSEGEERWYTTQIPPRRTEVLRGPVAQIHPLLALLDDGAPLGIAAVSSERVRLLDWRIGRVEQLHSWELEYFGEDWRERKAQRPRDPARGEAVSASGRDQYDQRMEDTRERFAEQTGELARGEARKRGWRETLVFGDERYTRKFAEGFGAGLTHADEADLIAEPTAQLERRVEGMLPQLNRARETSLIDRIKEAAYAEGRSSLGVQETLQALQEGRVEHLVYDPGRDYSGVPVELAGPARADGPGLSERLVELALSTGAAVTPVEGSSAEALAEQGGVVALLRY